jgi:hypothetical protein
VALAAVVGPGRVLCVGADGHVGIELPSSPCCDDTAPADACGADGAQGGADDCCGPCTDVGLTGYLSTLGRGPTVPAPDADVVAADLPPSAIASAVAALALRGRSCLPRAPDIPRGALVHLRSVNLRC